MRRIEIYTSALDRQVVANSNWQNGKMRYIRIGSRFYRDDLTSINMLNETDNDDWVLAGQVTRWFKFKFRLKLIYKLWYFTK